MTRISGALGRAILSVFKTGNTDTPLVDLFKAEYSREYQYAIKNGVDVTDNFVKGYLAEYHNK